jgi:hypothetical protein
MCQHIEKNGMPCMGLIKKTIVEQQKSQTLAYVALGVSIIALFCVFSLMGGLKNAAR